METSPYSCTCSVEERPIGLSRLATLMHLCQPIPQEHRTLEFPDSLHSSFSPRLEELLGVIEDTHFSKGDSMFRSRHYPLTRFDSVGYQCVSESRDSLFVFKIFRIKLRIN